MTNAEYIRWLKLLDEEIQFDALIDGKDEMDMHEMIWALCEKLEQEPCEDRKQKLEKEYLFESLCEDLKKLQIENEKLRKALEQEKTGHWIKHDRYWECSECHTERAYGNEYCPDCGSHNGDIAKPYKGEKDD